tara:strand:- start:121 stop:366 length:246 start_codon:yes stop_codon:yes gene_type:complete
MASEVDKTRYLVRSIIDATNSHVDKGANPEEIMHALTFVLCLYKFKFGLSTEGLLQLLEKYILQMEYLDTLSDDPEPFAEG